ncbi:MAG: hypothetical protein WA477_11040, partial [Candidatus Sulfotelmatobacter sp.]
KLSMTVPTNGEGVYEADLPLGIYIMTAQGPPLFKRYRRPEFRVVSPINITLNATLSPMPELIDHEYAPTQEELSASKNTTYYDGDFFSVPSADGVAFRLYISYVKRVRTDYSYDYTGDNTPPYENSVFVAYNLFSLHANQVLYDMQSRRLEAQGNVVVENDSGQHRAYSMTFKIENGQAIQIR